MRALPLVWVMGALSLVACSSGSSGEAASDGGSGAAGASAGGSGGSATGGTGGGATGGTGGSATGGTGGSATGGTGGSATGGTGGSGTGGSGAGGSGGSGGSTGAVPQMGGCPVFTADDDWNKDISNAPVDASWTQKLLANVGNINIHPDYGGQYGIPINVVPGSQQLVPISFDTYASESDPGPYPFPGPNSIQIEGNKPTNCGGEDCHALVVDQGTCTLYEGYGCEYTGGAWHCANGAKWDLTKKSYGQRPTGWTSADAAGLPIAPGLVRYDEVQAGAVNHAIRFTVYCSEAKYTAPATHFAASGKCGANAPPMGLRVRLKASYDISKLSKGAQVVLTAMKKYGMILADNSSPNGNFYFQGEENPNWPDADISALKTVPASAFEVITPGPLGP